MRSARFAWCSDETVPAPAASAGKAIPGLPDRVDSRGRTTDRPRPCACVVLLHGLARTRHSMHRMQAALRAAGFHTANIGYPSRSLPIEQLARPAVERGIAQCRRSGAATIHFVTHSMGGIVLRYYLARTKPAGLGRVVMLSPPNRGSEAADALMHSPLHRWYNGPAGQQLGTDAHSIPLRLPPVDYPLGVITGNRVALFDRWLARAIPGVNDGKVAVERAGAPGMSDFLVVPCAHTFIMREPTVIAQTLHFLANGAFDHGISADRR